MSSLYKRATPAQRKILRMVEGVVRDVINTHPDWKIPDVAARSISKRAVGTLTAQWPDVLAASLATSSLRAGEGRFEPSQPPNGSIAWPKGRGALNLVKRTPLSKLRTLRLRLGIMAGKARKAGHTARYEALADALRVIDEVEKRK